MEMKEANRGFCTDCEDLTNSSAMKKATFIPPMLLLRTEKFREGPEWRYELNHDMSFRQKLWFLQKNSETGKEVIAG